MFMDPEEFDRLLESEEAAQRYLRGHCWVNHQRFCPRCKSRKNYGTADCTAVSRSWPSSR